MAADDLIGINSNAEKRVDDELLADFKRVTGKPGILFQMAEASLDHPKGQVDEVI